MSCTHSCATTALAQEHSISSGETRRGRGHGSIAQACLTWSVADTGHVHIYIETAHSERDTGLDEGCMVTRWP